MQPARLRPWILPLLLLALLGPLPAASFEIGQHGSRIELPEGWRREMINPDLGRDQFFEPQTQLFGFLVEFETWVDSEAGCRRILTDRLGLSPLKDGLEQNPIVFRRTEDGVFSTIRVDQTVNGLRLSYTFGVYSQDGLSYYFGLWGSAQQAWRVALAANLLPSQLRMPGPESAWQRALQPVRDERIIGASRLGWSWSPALLQPHQDPGDAFAAYTGSDEAFAVFLLGASRALSLEAVLAETRDAAVGGRPGWQPAGRDSLEIAGQPALRDRYHWVQDEQVHAQLECIAVDLGGGERLDLRFWYHGDDETIWAGLRDRFLDGITIEHLEPLPLGDDPGLPQHASYDDEPWLSAWLAERATQPALPLEGEPQTAWRDGEAWLLVDGFGLLRVEGEAVERVARWEQRRWQPAAAPWAGGLVTLDAAGALRPLGAGSATPLPELTATLLGGHPVAGLLAISEETVEPNAVLGSWGIYGASHTLTLSRLHPSAAPLTLPRIAGQRARAVALSGDGGFALATVTDPDPLRFGSEAEIRLQRYAADGSPLGAVETWIRIDTLVACADGYLVTGRPQADEMGIHLLAASGERRRLLASERCTGIGFDGERLSAVHAH